MQLFAKVDVNGDGSVTREELAKMVMSGGSPAAHDNKKPATPNAHEAGPSGRTHGASEGHPNGPPHGMGPGRPGIMGGPGFGPGPGGFGLGGFPGGFGPRGPGAQFGGPGRAGFQVPNAEAILNQFDKDHSGFVTKDSVPERLWDRISKADANGDGKVSKEELEAHFKTLQPRRPGEAEESTKPAETPNESKPEEKPKGNSPQAGSRASEEGFRIG